VKVIIVGISCGCKCKLQQFVFSEPDEVTI